MNFLSKALQISFIAIFTLTISAEYKLGRDYKLASNPLPVKKDGIVEVTESFWYGCYGCFGRHNMSVLTMHRIDLISTCHAIS